MYLKKELYELIKTDESIFDFIQEGSLDGLWYWDLENPENEWMSARFWTVLGYNPDEMPHKSSAWQKIVNQDDLKVATENFIKHCEDPNHPYDQVVRYTHKNGSTVWIRCRGLAIRDKDGKPIRMIGAHQDLTGLKQAEEKHAQVERTYKEIFNSITDSVFIQEIETGDILDINDSMLEKFGYKREEIPHLSIVDLSAPEEAPGDELITDLLQRASQGETIVFEWLCRKKNGMLFPGEISLKSAYLGGIKRIISVLRDITERKKYEEQLKLQAEILDQIGDHVSVTDLKGEIIYANKAECNSIGLTKEQIIGKSIEIFGEDEVQGSTQNEILETTLNTGAWRGEIVNYDKEGDLNRILDCRTTLLMDSNNNPKGLIGVSSDITAHKRAEDKLRKSEESSRKKIQAILEPKGDIGTLNLGDILDRDSLQALIDDFYKIARVPTAMVDLAGQTLIKVGFQDICVKFHRNHPESMKNCHEAVTLHAEGVAPGKFKAFRCKNNLWDIVTPVFIGSKHMGNIFIGQFIYEDEPLDYELFKSRAHQYGFNEAEYLNALDRLPRLSREMVEATIRFYSRISSMISSLSYSKINLARALAMHKSVEKELILAKEKAEESDRLKSAFLANMSHEIRTPMNGILGFADLLKEPGLTGERKQQYISIIKKSGDRMLNIINDIVDISKIEAGLMELDIKESNINEQIEYIYTSLKPEAENKGIKLFVDRSLFTEKISIKTDSEKVYSILTNLVKNAIKYTHSGSVKFGYDLIEKDSSELLLQFYVKDTGIGIPKDRHEAIFKRFIQADIEDRMAFQGAGLGLSISKSYAEMLGGKITLESEEGKGSTFFFTLPYNAQPEAENLKQQLVSPAGELNEIKDLKILIAEDDEVSGILIERFLKDYSKDVFKAKTGIEAVELCRANPEIDLILMDIRMPEMGGHAATKKIREFNKDVVIIAQTAYAQLGDREVILEAGCNDYITKPIDQSALEALINKYFGK